MSTIDSLLAELTSGDDLRARRAVSAIQDHGEKALDPLRNLLGHPNADYRWWAVRALAELADRSIPALFTQMLEDPDDAVKQCAAMGLSRQPDPETIPALVSCLGSQDRQLARLAAIALTAIGGRSVPELLKVMNTGSPKARLDAVRALAEISDPRAIPVFFKAIRDGDTSLVEYWSEVGLEKLGLGMAFFKP